MSDLVKRLRSENTMHGYYNAPEIQIEAANCIESQTARIAELEAALQEAKSLLLQAHDTIFRLHENNDTAARNLITKIRVGFSGTLERGKE